MWVLCVTPHNLYFWSRERDILRLFLLVALKRADCVGALIKADFP